MAKNSRPILSVLIEEDKRTKFADLARRHSLSMGWLVNQAVDRMLEADSIDIYRDSIERIPAGTPMGVPIENLLPPPADIESIVKSSIESELFSSHIEGLFREYVERVSVATDAKVISDIELEIDPVTQSIEELRSELLEVSEFARNLQGEIVKVKKPLAIV